MVTMSLSWLVVTTRQYSEDWIWYLDKEGTGCYGCYLPDGEDKDSLCRQYRFEDASRLVLMPESHGATREEQAEYIRNWCKENDISFVEDLDKFDAVEAHYFGYENYEGFDAETWRAHSYRL